MTERRFTRSPVWVRPRDTFSGGRPQGRLTTTLERQDGTTWVPAVERATISASGDLAFLGLGRSREPAAIGLLTYRLRAEAAHYRIDYPPPGDALVFSVPAWRHDQVPVASIVPLVLPFLPAATYPFPRGTPLAHGRVVDAGGGPAIGAEVRATVTVAGMSLTERVLSDEHGEFRLPLRWAAGTTQLVATRGAASGSVLISVPDDLSATHTIAIT